MINDPVLANDWHPVASLEELKKQNVLGTQLLGQDIVLWRTNDQILAWQDLCIHRGTRLSLGRVSQGDKLECPYHGWAYDLEGKCIHIPAHPDQTPPAKAQVKTYQAQERYGLVWVSLGRPGHGPPPCPEWEDASYYKALWGPKQVSAGAPRIIENFLDIAHLPFVHEGILGHASRPEIPEYEAKIGTDGVKSGRIGVYQPSPYGEQGGGTVYYTYSAFRPLTAHFLKESANLRYAILLVVTPQKETESTARAIIATTQSDASDEDLRDRLDTIFGQDQPIIESQRPELLPLDLQAELHLRSDRMAIAYRKWLNDLGLSFGTA